MHIDVFPALTLQALRGRESEEQMNGELQCLGWVCGRPAGRDQAGSWGYSPRFSKGGGTEEKETKEKKKKTCKVRPQVLHNKGNKGSNTVQSMYRPYGAAADGAGTPRRHECYAHKTSCGLLCSFIVYTYSEFCVSTMPSYLQTVHTCIHMYVSATKDQVYFRYFTRYRQQVDKYGS